MNRNLNNIVVVGGGTAGWLTALMCHKYIPGSNITLVESEEIGILGAGEGSTPHLPGLIQDLGINMHELMYHSAATLKNGIKFTNWNDPEGEYYYHNFFSTEKELQETDSFGIKSTFRRYNVFQIMEMENAKSKADIDLIGFANELNNTLFMENNGIYADSVNRYVNIGSFGLHFNAVKLAKFLRKKAEDRGIKRIEGKVSEIISGNNGEISELKLEDGTVVPLDFVFDCSGFHRLIIGKHFKSEWNSYTDYISTTHAAPFFLPIDLNEDIPPYTEAIAMKYGWVWKIPTTDRYGCGYVFDPKYTNLDDVKKELEEHFKQPIEIPRVFEFEPGSYKEHWIKNCIAIGLSSGFIEPLEATSIYTSINSLEEALCNLTQLKSTDDFYRTEYNNNVNKWNTDVMSFIYLHYLSKRNDTDFWKKFKNPILMPERTKSLLNAWRYFPPRSRDFSIIEPFGFFSHFQVGYGIDIFNKEIFSEIYNDKNLGLSLSLYNEKKETQKRKAKLLTPHKKFINTLRARYDATN